MVCVVSTKTRSKMPEDMSRQDARPIPVTVDLDDTWILASDVALRPEPFGALAYHFGTRRLTFLKRKELAAVVTGLSALTPVRQALLDAHVPEPHWPSYLKALESLASTGMITRCDEREIL